MTYLGMLLGALLAAGMVLAVAASKGWTIPKPRHFTRGRLKVERDRAIKAVAAALMVAVITRWPVAAASAGALTWLWPQLFGGARDGRMQLGRLRAVATWTESLRDTMAAAVGLEQAIISSVDAAPDAIAPQLNRLVGRLRSHIALPAALAMFAEEFDDASVDLVVAALILNARLRGSGLVTTLTALSITAREELEMRTRVEEGRKNLRRSANIIVGVTIAFAGLIMVFSRDYLAPYGSVVGQFMLMLVVGGFALGFAWIRKASRAEPVPRFLGSSDKIADLTGVGA